MQIKFQGRLSLFRRRPSAATHPHPHPSCSPVVGVPRQLAAVSVCVCACGRGGGVVSSVSRSKPPPPSVPGVTTSRPAGGISLSDQEQIDLPGSLQPAGRAHL